MTVSAVLDKSGSQSVPVRLARTDFDRDDLTSGQVVAQDAVGGTYRFPNGSSYLENHSGVSLHELISAGVGVAVDNVSSVDVQLSGQTTGGRLSSRSADLTSPTDDAFPFTDAAEPALVYDGDDLLFAVGSRSVLPDDPPVMNGSYYQATPGQVFTITLHLSSTLQYPQATADPASATVGQTVQFHGQVDRVDPTQPLTWTWTVGTQPLGTGADPTSTFSSAGHFEVTATVTAPDGSSGTASTFVDVTDTSTPPPPTSPPPTQAGGGTGPSNAPNVGPRQGSGPVVGGVPTARPGTGAPGRSYAPSRSGTVSTATPTAGSTAAAGSIVGYLLSNATAAVDDTSAAARPRDDAATALRSGVDAASLPGWLLGAGAVGVLVALGALSERRRPATPRPRPRRKR